MDAPQDERMDGFISVFNGHINDADKRARAILSDKHREEVERIEREGEGIMAIFDRSPTSATLRYVELVTQFVNEPPN